MAHFVPVKSGEIINLQGGIQMRIQEDGSRTDNRIAAAEFTLPPKMNGPPRHWHEMHDETFLVTQGTVRFHTEDGHVDASVGDYVVVPIKAVHTFSNPTDEEVKFFNTFTPAFYINYFKLMQQCDKEGVLNREKVKEAMARYATVQQM